jgi:hypothetical protein
MSRRELERELGEGARKEYTRPIISMHSLILRGQSRLGWTQVIKAEDARLLQHMPTMKRMYGELHALNRELLGEVRFGTGG